MAKTVRSFAFEGLEIKPLTPELWPDLQRLFGPHGAYGGCWCMYWRIPHKQFEKQLGAANKRAFKKLIAGGEVPGILAYRGGVPVAWCSIAPRECYPALELSRALARIDDAPVWSIVCFYLPRALRGQGLLGTMTRAAVEYARRAGARIVEAYPFVPRTPRAPGYMGRLSTYLDAGFREALRRIPTRPILRLELASARSQPALRKTAWRS